MNPSVANLCAICTSDRGPFTREPLGRNNALVSVCEDCSTTVPRAKEARFSYECREGISMQEMKQRLSAQPGGVAPKRGWIVMAKAPTPGWILVRVPVSDGKGRRRDRRAALATLRHQPWRKDLRYLGTTSTGAEDSYLLFERPDPERIAKMRQTTDNPLAIIEQYRSKP